MAKKYWLMKSEPGDFSIDDLKKSPGKTAHWDGVRNYQARNFMRDQMQVGDGVFFYHSKRRASRTTTCGFVSVPVTPFSTLPNLSLSNTGGTMISCQKSIGGWTGGESRPWRRSCKRTC